MHLRNRAYISRSRAQHLDERIDGILRCSPRLCLESHGCEFSQVLLLLQPIPCSMECQANELWERHCDAMRGSFHARPCSSSHPSKSTRVFRRSVPNEQARKRHKQVRLKETGADPLLSSSLLRDMSCLHTLRLGPLKLCRALLQPGLLCLCTLCTLLTCPCVVCAAKTESVRALRRKRPSCIRGR